MTTENAGSNEVDVNELRAEIARQRDNLAHDIDQLTDKLDVKAQAGKKAHQAADAVSGQVHQAAERVQPAVTAARKNRVPALAGLALVVLGGAILLRRRRR